MAVFEYTALTVKGKKISGIIDAESALAARQKLRASQNFPVSINEVHDKVAEKSIKKVSLPSLFQNIRPAQVAAVTRQMATLVGAGFTLDAALNSLLSQTRSRPLHRKLAQLKNAIVEGSSFAGALSKFPGTFPPLYVNMVRAGEVSGTLEIVLDRLADLTEKQQEIKDRIRAAAAYPILMTFIGILVLFFLLTYIVPNITSIFTDMNRVLPLPTRLLIGFSQFLKAYWWLLALVAAGLMIGIYSIRKTPKGRTTMDSLQLRLPVVGSLARKLAVARLTRTLGSLLENGVTLLASLEIVQNIVSNVILSSAVEAAAVDVGKGQGLADALGKTRVFPDLAIQMVQVGEQSGELEKMLNKVADVYEKEVERTVLSLTSLLEPVMILVMGVIVGFIVLSICLPIFEISHMVG
jgi:general secretion pathway protein F